MKSFVINFKGKPSSKDTYYTITFLNHQDSVSKGSNGRKVRTGIAPHRYRHFKDLVKDV